MPAPELPDDLVEAFEYLDDLRESGETNMFGAGPYLTRDMGYDRTTARTVLSAWMGTFDSKEAAEVRAIKAREQSA